MILDQCTPTAQWLFVKIQPMLENGNPYGYIHYFESEIGEMFRTSQPTISKALHELRYHGIMRKSKAGYWYCPPMIAEVMGRLRRD